MSWDIVLFNSRQATPSVEAIDEDMLEPTDFCSVLEDNFDKTEKDGKHRTIKGTGFEIDFFTDEEKVSNKLLSLYGEQGLYALVMLARQNGWQIFDTALDQMIDLDHPEKNGYENFIQYLQQILEDGKQEAG